MQMIEIDKIIIENKYLRFDTDVSKLQKSIETVGLIAPLIVNNQNLLIAGGRRYQALKNLRYKTVSIIRIEKSSLEEELISIDENLVRLDLSKIELEANLRRANELYQEMANTNETVSAELINQREMITEKIKEEKQLDEAFNSNTPNQIVENAVSKLASQKFLIDVSEKTGMSPRQVWQAIQRDEKSSHAVKDARSLGALNLGQTNELIKLKEDQQEQILPYIKGKTIKEIRKIVSEVRKNGVDEGIEISKQETPHAREITQLIGNLKKVQKITSKLELEGVILSGTSEKEIQKIYNTIMESMSKILEVNSFHMNRNRSQNQNEPQISPQ